MPNENDDWQDSGKFCKALGDTAIAEGHRVDAIHGPIWRAREGLAKTVLTLASGALVLSVTFMQSLSADIMTSNWRWILIGGWVSLCLVIIMALLSLWLSIGLYTLPARISGQHDAMRKEISKAMQEGRDPIQAVGPLMLEAAEPLVPVERRTMRSLGIALILFVVAMFLMGAVGVIGFAGDGEPVNKAIQKDWPSAGR